MHWRQLATSVAFGLLAAPAVAAPLCTNTTPLGSISAPNVADFAGSFDNAGQYIECFTFTPLVDIDGSIHVNDFDVGNNQLDIDVTRIELYNATELVASAPKHFDFGSLQPGVTYTLALYSDVSNSKGGSKNDPVSYKGRVETLTPTAPNVVPEPGILALLGMGLIAAAGAMWRRRATAQPSEDASNAA